MRTPDLGLILALATTHLDPKFQSLQNERVFLLPSNPLPLHGMPTLI